MTDKGLEKHGGVYMSAFLNFLNGSSVRISKYSAKNSASETEMGEGYAILGPPSHPTKVYKPSPKGRIQYKNKSSRNVFSCPNNACLWGLTEQQTCLLEAVLFLHDGQ